MKITLRSGAVVEHDESVSMATMRSTLPTFFATPHGHNEHVFLYRGCLIVRNTVQFTNCRPERKTTLYLYFHDLEGSGPNTLYVPDPGESVQAARRRVDEILRTGIVGDFAHE